MAPVAVAELPDRLLLRLGREAPDRQVGQREVVEDGAEPGVPERPDSEFLRCLAGCHRGGELSEPGGVQGGAQPVQLGELGQRSPVGVELVQRVLAVLGPHPGQAGQR